MDAVIESVHTEVRTFPLDEPEGDGTLRWDHTTAVVVTLHSGEHTGLGWTYSSPAAAAVIESQLAGVIESRRVSDISAGWEAMHRAGRNFGTRGLYLQAMSAVDIAWWDLKARVLEVSLVELLGRCRDTVPIYGSGGFTTFDEQELREQIEQWNSLGCSAMKIKIGEEWGTRTGRDLDRVRQLAEQSAAGVEIMVDANGGYSVAEARRIGRALDELGVVWFEEPVSSDDRSGLAAVRDSVRCDVAAGEYVSEVADAADLLPVIDCLQLDATRCGGYTGFLRAADLAHARNLQVSGHCAPALHAPVCAAVPHLRHVEYFADHAALEPHLVDGVPEVRDGAIQLNLTAPGHGMTLRT